MKKNLLLTIMLLSAMFAMAQSSITVKFTAEDQNGNYYQFDAVKVISISQNWNQTLAYPDTILILNYIDGIGEQSFEEGILQNRPNPFYGTTETTFNLVEDGPATVQILDMKGAVLAEYEADLTQGEHIIKVCLAEPQMVLLRANTNKQSYVAKLLNIGNGGENRIEISSTLKKETKVTKAVGAGSFSPGDVLSYVGIKMQGSDMVMSNNTVTQAQYADDVLTFVFDVETPEAPEGAINGLFSVSETKQVYFSKGNLQYQASTNTWRFAEHQYDMIGSANSDISSSYSGWIDFFGWGTSGWNSGANAYQPWAASTEYGDYYVGGSYTNCLTGEYSNADWGVYNAISNGGNRAGLWRILTKDEWQYLLFERNASTVRGSADARFAKARIDSVAGLIVFPDNFTMPDGVNALVNINVPEAAYSDNVYAAEQWTELEMAGAVFLPAAGVRSGTVVDGVGVGGRYWSSTYRSEIKVWSVHIDEEGLLLGSCTRSGGRSVRLVQDVN